MSASLAETFTTNREAILKPYIHQRLLNCCCDCHPKVYVAIVIMCDMKSKTCIVALKCALLRIFRLAIAKLNV